MSVIRANQLGITSQSWILSTFHLYKSPAACASKSMSVTPQASWKRARGKKKTVKNSLTMLQNAETAVGNEVLHTCRPTKYVSVFPVMGIPRICVRVILGISDRYGTKSGKINPYLWKTKNGLTLMFCKSVKGKVMQETYGPGGRCPWWYEAHPVDLMSKMIGICSASEMRLVASKWEANFLEPSLLSNTLHKN